MAPPALEASGPLDLLVRSPPQVVRVLHAPPSLVLARRRRLDLDSDCYPILPLFLTSDLVRGMIDLSKNHLQAICNSAPATFTASSGGSTVTSDGSIVRFFANIFPFFYKMVYYRTTRVETKKLVPNKLVHHFTLFSIALGHLLGNLTPF